MTISASAFLVEFPEYAGAPLALVQAKLDEAYLTTPLDPWGDLQDTGAKYLAAHLLALSPNARELQLVREDGSSIYLDRRKQLMRTAAMGVGRLARRS